VSTVILLAPALSPAYDLRGALARTQYGIFNYYSEFDVLLRAGTTVAGTIDRAHAQSAGAVGFDEPAAFTAQDRSLYDKKLHQIKYAPEMGWAANFGGHMDWTHRPFVRRYLAPLVTSLSTWKFDSQSDEQPPDIPPDGQSIVKSNQAPPGAAITTPRHAGSTRAKERDGAGSRTSAGVHK
jgi:hypothetical protein